MELKNSCRFCEIASTLENGKELGLSYADKPVLKSKNFFVIQAKHRVTEGHTILIANKHYLSFSQLSDEEYAEFNPLLNRIHVILTRIYGAISIFEHGMPSDSLSQCIEHAHIHFLPIKNKISPELDQKFELVGEYETWEKLNEYLKPPYIVIKEQAGNWKYYKVPDDIPGQYICRLYAATLNKSDEWLKIILDESSFEKTWEQLKGEFNFDKDGR